MLQRWAKDFQEKCNQYAVFCHIGSPVNKYLWMLTKTMFIYFQIELFEIFV